MIAASTLGAPGEPLSQVTASLLAHRIDGIEIRLVDGGIAWLSMTDAEADGLRRALEAAGISVIALASYARVAAPAADDEVADEMRRALELASRIGAEAIRVFPGAPAVPLSISDRPRLVEDEDRVAGRAARRLDDVARTADALGVAIALETHDSHPRAIDVRRILERAHSPVRVVWDVLHPWRTGEPVAETADLLAPWLRLPGSWVQIKDARIPDSITPVLIGSGTVPLDEAMASLAAQDYRGPLSLEWERAWYPEIASFDTALRTFRRWLDLR